MLRNLQEKIHARLWRYSSDPYHLGAQLGKLHGYVAEVGQATTLSNLKRAASFVLATAHAAGAEVEYRSCGCGVSCGTSASFCLSAAGAVHDEISEGAWSNAFGLLCCLAGRLGIDLLSEIEAEYPTVN